MQNVKIRPGKGLAWAAVLVVVGLALPARAAEDETALQERALELNKVTGNDPIKGQILTLLKDAPGSKKLLPVATRMSKEKEQPFNINAAYILARTARALRDVESSQHFYRLYADLALKLLSGEKLAQAYSGLIDLYYENKKFAESEKVCQEFLELDVDDTVERYKGLMQRRLIQAIAKQGKADEANKLVDRLVKRSKPNNWLVLELKGWVRRETGRIDEAVKTYEDVLEQILKDKELTKEERNDYSSEIRYTLSNVYIDLKQIDKATEQLKALLALEPDNPTYNNDLGYIWADNDTNLDEAEKMIRKAIEQDRKQRKEANPDLKPEEDKDNAAYLDSLGWVLFRQKKYKEAKPYLLEAVKDPEGRHIEIYDHLGDVHLILGEKPEATAAWKKGIEVAGPSKREQQRKAEVEKKLMAARAEGGK